MLARGLSVAFNYGYVDPECKKIKAATGPDIALEFRFIHVPKNSYALDVNYTYDDLAVGTLRANFNYSWQGRAFSNTPRIFGQAYGIKSVAIILRRLS